MKQEENNDLYITGRMAAESSVKRVTTKLDTVEEGDEGDVKKLLKLTQKTYDKKREIVGNFWGASKLADRFPRLSSVLVREIVEEGPAKKQVIKIDLDDLEQWEAAVRARMSEGQLPKITPVS